MLLNETEREKGEGRKEGGGEKRREGGRKEAGRGRGERESGERERTNFLEYFFPGTWCYLVPVNTCTQNNSPL